MTQYPLNRSMLHSISIYSSNSWPSIITPVPQYFNYNISNHTPQDTSHTRHIITLINIPIKYTQKQPRYNYNIQVFGSQFPNASSGDHRRFKRIKRQILQSSVKNRTLFPIITKLHGFLGFDTVLCLYALNLCL